MEIWTKNKDLGLNFFWIKNQNIMFFKFEFEIVGSKNYSQLIKKILKFIHIIILNINSKGGLFF